MTFGPDGDLYVTSVVSREVIRIDGRTGSFRGVFVRVSGGLVRPEALAFGPDGHLYVADVTRTEIRKYDGATGQFLGVVVDFDVSRRPRAILFASRSADPQEPGLAGRTVFLDQNRNGRREPGEGFTTTDARGSYRFDDLAPGSYRVVQKLQSGWTPSHPLSQSYDVTVVEGRTAFEIDFGNVEESGPVPNLAPEFVSQPPSAITVGHVIVYPARALDPNGDLLTFTLSVAPTGMAVDPLTGVVV